MKNLLGRFFLFTLCRCEPIPQKTLPQQKRSNSESSASYLIAFENPYLKVLPDDVEIPRNAIREYEKNIRVFADLSPIDVTEISFGLDTIVVRWTKLDTAIRYNGSLMGLFGEEYLNFDADQNSYIIVPKGIKNGVSSLALDLESTNRERNMTKHILFSQLGHEIRSQLLDKLSEMDFPSKVSFLLKEGLKQDALTLIELKLLREYRPELVSLYWDIVKK